VLAAYDGVNDVEVDVVGVVDGDSPVRLFTSQQHK
jgi:hypothetical protein